jgi:uncharacterized protein YbbC (DUF1343 family)
MQKVINGIDVFLSEPGVNKSSRFAIVTNNAAFTADKLLSRLGLVKQGFNLVKLFSPEHGISVRGEDGVYQNHSLDIKTNLPVISLYGDRLIPTAEDLDDVDIVLFDIPDVGCRFYTYLWTMTYAMEACAKHGKQMIILDRPNPIGGDLTMAEGPLLDEQNCSSFIGRWSIPIRHSCTFGELAKYFVYKKIKGLNLEIVTMKNWKRNEIAKDFYPTSPAIQNISTALVYPGMGLLEGINVNEGRGTDKPFLQFGAPWINAGQLDREFGQKRFPGINIKPVSYVPVSSVYRNEECNGLELSVTATNKFYPVRFGIGLVSILFTLYPNHIEERAYITNANPKGTGHLDKLLGAWNSFELFRSGAPISTDISKIWAEEISPFLLYY